MLPNYLGKDGFFGTVNVFYIIRDFVYTINILSNNSARKIKF